MSFLNSNHLLKYLWFALGSAFTCEPLRVSSKQIPVTREGLWRAILQQADFIQFIVCPKCDSVYDQKSCMRGGKMVLTTCTHKSYPNDPMICKRKECGVQLMKVVKTKSGTLIKPKKVFPYQSLHKALQNLLNRSGFIVCCGRWRTRPRFRDFGYMCDVYDGLVWEEFNNFLSAPYNYLLTLNVDWFSLFKHGRYSVGGIYMTIQNLPAHLRNHPGNIVLVGIIPGPSEPRLNMNSYLKPLQIELLNSWTDGIPITVSKCGQTQTVLVHVAISCVACDIPAMHKLVGFPSIKASLACNKCLKPFVHVRNNESCWTNHSGYDKSTWVVRTNRDHRSSCKDIYDTSYIPQHIYTV